jgi:hypothetical protein
VISLVIRGLRTIELATARGYLASDEQSRLVQNLAGAIRAVHSARAGCIPERERCFPRPH